MNPGGRPGGHNHALGLDRDTVGLGVVLRDPLAQRRDAERLGVADVADFERGLRRSDRAVVGAGAAGWPTSMCTTRPPRASMRAAAAITSITMKGGTSLRADGMIRRRALSSIMSSEFSF